MGISGDDRGRIRRAVELKASTLGALLDPDPGFWALNKGTDVGHAVIGPLPYLNPLPTAGKEALNPFNQAFHLAVCSHTMSLRIFPRSDLYTHGTVSAHSEVHPL